MLILSESLRSAYPGGFIGAMRLANASNLEGSPPLEEKKAELAAELKRMYRNFNRADLMLQDPVKAYVEYYKRFKKTYHVLMQLESVVFKSKPIPRVASLVEAMFMAELKNLLLTAGHDLDAVRLPIRVDLSQGTERYILLNGQEKELAPGDMMMADGAGIISSILFGPDQRTRIRTETKDVLYVVYAPPGINSGLIERHLQDIVRYAKTAAPAASLELLEIYPI